MYRALIPNMLTASNLFFGMCSILSTYHGHLDYGAIFILVALVADGLDGRAARFFGVSSEMGKEMDSLCDLVSFGVAPGFDPHRLGWMYPAVMLLVAFLMISEVHYPDFKGSGERIYPVSVAAAVLVFASILYVGHAAIFAALLFAAFATYAVLGIVNTLCTRLFGAGR